MASSPQKDSLKPWWKGNQINSSLEDPGTKKVSCYLWKYSALEKKPKDFYVEAFESYKPIRMSGRSMLESKFDECPLAKQNCTSSIRLDEDHHVTKLCSDYKALFEGRKRTDLTIFVKGERDIKCHSLVIFVRCRKIMDEIIEQKSEGAGEQIIIWDSIDYDVATDFLRYIYTAEVPKHIQSKAALQQHKKSMMSSFYKQFKREYILYTGAYMCRK